MPSVLFISHFSGRNGAPLVLLRLLQWLKAHTSLELHVMLRSPGELQRDFESVASVFIVPRLPKNPAAVLRRVTSQPTIDRLEDALLRRQVRRLRPVLIYSNTITNTREIAALAELGAPVLCHVHELEYWIRYELGLQQAVDVAPLTRRYVAAGNAVKAFLTSGVGVHPDAIEVIPDFSSSSFRAPENAGALRQVTRQELPIDESTFLVGGCGTVDWRKGVDLFLATARAVLQTSPSLNVHFIWVGGPVAGQFFNQLKHDLARCHLSERVSFIGPSAAPDRYFAAMDAFMLPSREDPCPLVMLEAAAFALPILCFDESGGASEFVADGAGIAVPYLDVRGMMDALFALERTPTLRHRLGNAARERVQLRHNPDTQCAAIFEAMKRTQPLLGTAKRT